MVATEQAMVSGEAVSGTNAQFSSRLNAIWSGKSVFLPNADSSSPMDREWRYDPAKVADWLDVGRCSAPIESHLDQFELAARYRPRRFATPDIDNLAGLQSEAQWSHYWIKYFSSDSSGSDNHLFIRTGSETNEFANGNLRFRPARGVVVSTGLTVSYFSDQGALFPDVHQFSVPISISYDRPHYGVGLQYQYSQTSRAFSPGESYGGSLRRSGGHFQANAHAGLNTDALGVDSFEN